MVSILSAARDLERLRRIYVVLVRHGFGEVAQRLGFGAGKKARALLSASGDAVDVLVEAVPQVEAEHGEEERRKVSLAERVRLVAQDLGPSFIKLGQIASTRPDVLPDRVDRRAEEAPGRGPPVPFAEIKDAIEAVLGRTLAEST